MRFCGAFVVLLLALAANGTESRGSSAAAFFPPYAIAGAGPLRVLASNPRYFTDGTGRAIYLTGSHIHTAFKDRGLASAPAPHDYIAYLEFLAGHHHNFMRLWTWELTEDKETNGAVHYWSPFPWQRTGPGVALDGLPKFDLGQFDQAYFDRLRSRVIAAADRGIYVSVMLFEGWAMQNGEIPWGWLGHPFNSANNINGIDGDIDKDGKGLESHTMQIPEVLGIEEDYVRKVIDTLNDLDNVIYEISNEDHPGSVDWQYHFIDFIHNYELTKAKQHPVGMTTHVGIGNQAAFDSPAEWISPAVSVWGDPNDPYCAGPPETDGSKVILLDTDHLWGMGGDRVWVWKSFLRGYNPIYMDLDTLANDPLREGARIAMGQTLSYAERMNLASMLPSGLLTSTGYCLANPGREYLIYQPSSGPFSLDIAAGDYAFEWFNPGSYAVVSSGKVTPPGGKMTFSPPFGGDAVLYLKASPQH